MATISFGGATDTQITVNIGHSGSAVDNFKLFCDGISFSTDTFPSTTNHSTQRTKTGLAPSTSHFFSVYYYRGTVEVHSASGTFSTEAPPPPPVPGPVSGLQVFVSGQAPSASVTGSWNSASGATSYDWSAAGQSGSVTSTSKNITVSSAGSYTFVVTPRNNSGTGTSDSEPFTVNPAPINPPGPISSPLTGYASAGRTINCSWGSASGATGYELWVRDADSGTFFKKYDGSSTSASFIVNYEYTDYPIEVRAKNSAGYGGLDQTVVKSLDETAPIISGIVVVTPTNNNATVSAHSGVDASPGGKPGSGINYYQIYYGIGDTSTASPTNFVGNLAENVEVTITGLQPLTTYTIFSRAFDRGNNGASDADRTIGSFTTRAPRPPLFSWDSAKVSGGPFNVTANEWNRLKVNVDAVRDYLEMPPFAWNYNASPASPGQAFTAARWNDMRNATLNVGANPPPPPSHFINDLIYASEINQFRDSINSVP